MHISIYITKSLFIA